MKYIKRFNEGFFDFLKRKKKVEDSEILYRETSVREFNKFKEDHIEELFTQDETNNIENKLKSKSNYNRYNEWEWKKYSGLNDTNKSKIRFGNGYEFCDITKYQDEWYTIKHIDNVSYNENECDTYYILCDSIEGVYQFLKKVYQPAS